MYKTQTRKHIKKKLNKPVKALFSLSFLSLSISNALATEQLETINVDSGLDETPLSERKIGQNIKSAKMLEAQQIQDSRDLVKYETGISVVEKGRMGASGFAVRGVEENRVNITVDGLQQTETISSQGFKELFEGYGNFNNTRNGLEMETLKQVNIAKGSDSTKVGNGALGGAVIFETKDARDLLGDKDFYFKTKTGYSSRNGEYMFSPTIAGRWKYFDILAIHTDRDGHETKNFGYSHYPDVPEASAQGRSRQKADPYHIEKRSTLFKFGINPNETNRFTITYDDYENHSKGTDWSYTLAPLQTDQDKAEKETRHTNDSSKRKNIAFSFENFDSNFFYDTMKVTYSHQKITQRAQTDEYCDGGENCEDVSNPLDLQFKNGQILDKNGDPLKFGEEAKIDWNGDVSATEKTLALVDKNGKPFPVPMTETWDNRKVPQNQSKVWDTSSSNNELWLNCQTNDCNGALTFYRFEGYSGDYHFNPNDPYKEVAVDLNSNGKEIIETKQTAWGSTKKEKTVFNVEDIQRGGQHWKHISVGKTNWVNKGDAFLDPDYEGWRSDIINSQGKKNGYTRAQDFMLIKPDSPGVSTDMYKDRHLNTDIKQIDFDFNKAFEIKGVENNLNYRLLLSRMDKSMINYSGYKPTNRHWWATNFNTIDENGQPACIDGVSGCVIKREGTPTTFLIPVKTDTGAFSISDNIRVNDYLAFDLSYRYDKIHQKPHYDPMRDPVLPHGMLRGMYVKEKSINEPRQPSWLDGGWRTPKYPGCQTGTCKNPDGSYQDPQYAQAMKQYEEDLADYRNNPQKNMDYLVNHSRKFSHHSYSLASTIDPLDFMRVQVKYSTGFRAPTSDELYFTFKHPDFTIIANPDLEPETAKTKEMALTFHHNDSFITFGGFRTHYDNFLQLAFRGYKQFKDDKGNTAGTPYRTYQNVNNSVAKVKGFNISAKLFLADLTEKLDGFSVGYKLEYQKGKTFGIDEEFDGKQREIWYPLNSISPMKQVFNLGYYAPNRKYGLDLYFTHVSAKKAKDSYNPYHAADQGIFNAPDYDPNNIQAKHLSDSYDLWDLITFYKPTKHLTLQLGLYNIFNKKYATWDSIRSIRQFGTSNMICKQENPAIGCYTKDQGIERFYAPGRNFKLNMSMEF